MPCLCANCGRPMEECEFKICVRCHIEGADETTKNILAGGRFYGVKLGIDKSDAIKEKAETV